MKYIIGQLLKAYPPYRPKDEMEYIKWIAEDYDIFPMAGCTNRKEEATKFDTKAKAEEYLKRLPRKKRKGYEIIEI